MLLYNLITMFKEYIPVYLPGFKFILLNFEDWHYSSMWKILGIFFFFLLLYLLPPQYSKQVTVHRLVSITEKAKITAVEEQGCWCKQRTLSRCSPGTGPFHFSYVTLVRGLIPLAWSMSRLRQANGSTDGSKKGCEEVESQCLSFLNEAHSAIAYISLTRTPCHPIIPWGVHVWEKAGGLHDVYAHEMERNRSPERPSESAGRYSAVFHQSIRFLGSGLLFMGA